MNKVRMTMAVFSVVALVAGIMGCGGDAASPTPTDGATPTPEPVVLKLVTASTPGSKGALNYYHFADLVEEYTDGRVLVDIYPGSQLFPATEQWEAVVTGSIDIFADASYYIREAVPDVLAFYLDGLWESQAHGYAALENSDLTRMMAEKVEEAGPVKMLGFFPVAGTTCLMNSVKETVSLKDCEGLKVQGSPGSPQGGIHDYTGTSSVPIAFEEISAAFIQGVVDAVLLPAYTIVDLGLQEAGKHALCRTSMFATIAIMINGDSWEELSADLQDIMLNEVMPEAYEFAKETYREDEEAGLRTLEQSLETFHWVEEEDLRLYHEYLPTNNVQKLQILMIDPKIIEIVEALRPSSK